RILTSGQAKSAFEGRETIIQMREHAKGRIEILPGGGIRPDNVIELLDYTGCDQIHLSMTRRCADDSISANPDIRFGSQLPSSESIYSLADREKIAAIVHQVNS
ncbi:MAG: copper homeostasis protein CutC, partial [Clostridiaceae bacterium]|nr:copper homeostasis protein CutC [Clostridiaceae bacterium]